MVLKKVILAILIIAASSNAAIAELVVVVHPSNQAELDAKTIQRIFLGKEKTFDNGNAISPINLAPENALRAQFDQDLVGRSSSQVSAYWSKLVFTGKGVPPKEVASEAEVIAEVSSNTNAIAYISKASATNSVRVISLQ
jgi:ABC-type phosphate transport system substrate-binding protein